MNERSESILVIVTAPDVSVARSIAAGLIEKKIAACVNISPGWTSIYRWEGDVQEDTEVILYIKTIAGLFESKLIPLVQELHPYDLPEIIGLPIQAGEPDYMEWITNSVSRE